jgi:hypothetical protein
MPLLDDLTELENSTTAYRYSSQLDAVLSTMEGPEKTRLVAILKNLNPNFDDSQRTNPYNSRYAVSSCAISRVLKANGIAISDSVINKWRERNA